MKKLFNLHAELGECTEGHYFKLVFDDGTEFINKTKFLTDAISSSSYRLDKASDLLKRLVAGEIKSVDFTVSNSVKASMPKLKNGQKLTPKDLTQIDRPDCQPICTSWEFFGKGKCENMCGSKFN